VSIQIGTQLQRFQLQSRFARRRHHRVGVGARQVLHGAAFVAWGVLVVMAIQGHHHIVSAVGQPHTRANHQMPNHGFPVAPANGFAREVSKTFVAYWVIMVIAMMAPLWRSTVERVARATYKRSRGVTVTVHVGTLVILWLAFGMTVRLITIRVVPQTSFWIVSAGCFVVGALLELSLTRSRLMASCDRNQFVAAHGRRAITTSIRAAAASWPRCAMLCGPVMVAMTVEHRLETMVAASGAVWWEQRRPRNIRDPIPMLLLILGAVLVVGRHLSAP
jgi:predicted metal-binding membrane protein